ncbi:UDP-glucose 4-epimerase [Massilia sp. UYP11]
MLGGQDYTGSHTVSEMQEMRRDVSAMRILETP